MEITQGGGRGNRHRCEIPEIWDGDFRVSMMVILEETPSSGGFAA